MKSAFLCEFAGDVFDRVVGNKLIMELTYAELSSPGPARENNEDYVGFWQPETLEDKRSRGAVAVLADGVGGMQRGEIASRLAVETALKIFRETPENLSAEQLLTRLFNAANLAVYDKGMENHGKARMPLDAANSQKDGRRGEPIVSREKQGAHASRESVRSSIVPHSPLRARAGWPVSATSEAREVPAAPGEG